VPPEIYDTMLRYKADLAAREAVAMRSLATRYLGIMRGLDEDMAELARIMAERRARGLEVTPGYLYRNERYRALLAQAAGEFDKYEDFAADLIARNTTTYANLGRQHGASLLNMVEPGVVGSFNRLPVGAIENIAGAVSPGSPLRTLLAGAWPHAIEQTTAALVRGVALGYNPRKIAGMMRDGIGGGLQRSMVVARTETLRAYRTSKMDVWRASGAVEGFQRVAAHDRRVCPACLMADGEFIPLQADFAEHPQGRCAVIPCKRKSDPHKWQYGPEWFEQQPTSTQAAILGPGRLAAWQAGQFDLRDIPVVQGNNVWGPSLRARGLAELTGDVPRGVRFAVSTPPPLLQNIVLESTGATAEMHIQHYAKIPATLRDAVEAKGVKVYINNDATVPNIDDMKHLRKVTPRGWRKGDTWDKVPGAYIGEKKFVVAGNGRHGSASLLLHEYGHAAGDVLGYNNDVRLIRLHKNNFSKLPPYLQQGGMGATAGRREYLAEAFAQTLVDEVRAVDLYGDDMVVFLKNVVMQGGEARLK
jgi:SPP1 gp7 family putative phage head morphogenesis protein